MTDKEVEIIYGVIRGILAFLSNPRNEEYAMQLIAQHENVKAYPDQDAIDRFYSGFHHKMNVPTWLCGWHNHMRTDFIYDNFWCWSHQLWQQCVDHALMILESEYQYD